MDLGRRCRRWQSILPGTELVTSWWLDLHPTNTCRLRYRSDGQRDSPSGHRRWRKRGNIRLGPQPKSSGRLHIRSLIVLGPYPPRSISTSVHIHLGPYPPRSISTSVHIHLGPYPHRSISTSVHIHQIHLDILPIHIHIHLGPYPPRSISTSANIHLGPYPPRSISTLVHVHLGPYPPRSISTSVHMPISIPRFIYPPRYISISNHISTWISTHAPRYSFDPNPPLSKSIPLFVAISTSVQIHLGPFPLSTSIYVHLDPYSSDTYPPRSISTSVHIGCI